VNYTGYIQGMNNLWPVDPIFWPVNLLMVFFKNFIRAVDFNFNITELIALVI